MPWQRLSFQRIKDKVKTMTDKNDLTAQKISQNKEEQKGSFDEFVSTLLWAALFALVIRSLFFEPFSIPSGSMKPTLVKGDFLFVNKMVYGYSRYSFPLGLGPIPEGTRVFGNMPERGDIIVFKLPTNPSVDYIKRVVGLPGDEIQVRGGRLFINDEIVERDEIGSEATASAMGFPQSLIAYNETLPNGVEHAILEESDDGPLDNTKTYIVPENHVFAMGDNRDNSQDSRVDNLVGYIPLENIVGRAERIFMSVDSEQGKIWEIWNWPKAIQFERVFNNLRPHAKDGHDS